MGACPRFVHFSNSGGLYAVLLKLTTLGTIEFLLPTEIEPAAKLHNFCWRQRGEVGVLGVGPKATQDPIFVWSHKIKLPFYRTILSILDLTFIPFLSNIKHYGFVYGPLLP